jgi:hypothetical protein
MLGHPVARWSCLGGGVMGGGAGLLLSGVENIGGAEEKEGQLT